MQALTNSLPYKKITRSMVIDIVNFIMLCLDAFPANGGESNTIITRITIMGENNDFKRHCKVEFGAYCQKYEDNAPTNKIIVRTKLGMCLGTRNKRQGGTNLYFLTPKLFS